MFDDFFDRMATIGAVAWPQDPSGGPVPSPAAATVVIPACVQQDARPERAGEKSSAQRSTSELAIFLGVDFADDPAAALAAVLALGPKDELTLDDGRVIVLDGPAFDRSGRGQVLEAAGRYTT